MFFLESCPVWFNGVWLLHTLKRSSTLCFLSLVCIWETTKTVIVILHFNASCLSIGSSCLKLEFIQTTSIHPLQFTFTYSFILLSCYSNSLSTAETLKKTKQDWQRNSVLSLQMYVMCMCACMYVCVCVCVYAHYMSICKCVCVCEVIHFVLRWGFHGANTASKCWKLNICIE